MAAWWSVSCDKAVQDRRSGDAGDDGFIASLATDLVRDAKRKEVTSRPHG